MYMCPVSFKLGVKQESKGGASALVHPHPGSTPMEALSNLLCVKLFHMLQLPKGYWKFWLEVSLICCYCYSDIYFPSAFPVTLFSLLSLFYILILPLSSLGCSYLQAGSALKRYWIWPVAGKVGDQQHMVVGISSVLSYIYLQQQVSLVWMKGLLLPCYHLIPSSWWLSIATGNENWW